MFVVRGINRRALKLKNHLLVFRDLGDLVEENRLSLFFFLDGLQPSKFYNSE